MANKNFASLQKAILDKAKKTMETKVLDMYIKTKMSDATEYAVYKKYSPQAYDRRKYQGLLSMNNIYGDVKDSRDNGFSFVVENRTLNNFDNATPRRYLAPLVIMGQKGMREAGISSQYMYQSDIAPYAQPRDFISETIKRMSKSDIAKSLDLHMRGV